MQRGKNRVDHQHLLVKELMFEIKKNSGGLKELLRQKNIDYYKLDHEGRKTVLHQVIQEFKETEEGEMLMEDIVSQFREQVEEVSSSTVKKTGYLVDCFREATAFPIAKERERPAFNLSSLHGKSIKKELRRVIWSRMFNVDRFRMAFIKWDREVTPYKVREELKVSLEKASFRHEMTLKDHQTDSALRIVEYFLKAQERLPQRYHFYLALLIVELYSYTKTERISELGAVTLGVTDLLQFYNEETESKIRNIKKALQIVDEESYAFIEDNYLNRQEGEKAERDLLQGFELFRLTAGTYYLPLQTGQFILDQLIIRKRSRLDIYCLFAIMILILSDELEVGLNKGLSLKQILNLAQEIIKKQEYVEAYNVIYEDVPAWFTAEDLERHPNNRLLTEMLTLEKDQTAKESLPEEDGSFVVQMNVPVRMGLKR